MSWSPLAMAYNEMLKAKIAGMKAAGADVIQIDEPHMQANPEQAGRYGNPWPQFQQIVAASFFRWKNFPAFREAAKLSVEFVEFDVHVFGDGCLVVHHEATLGRMTEQFGAIMDLASPEIAQAKTNGKDGKRPPLLAEVIGIFKPIGINLRLEIN